MAQNQPYIHAVTSKKDDAGHPVFELREVPAPESGTLLAHIVLGGSDPCLWVRGVGIPVSALTRLLQAAGFGVSIRPPSEEVAVIGPRGQP